MHTSGVGAGLGSFFWCCRYLTGGEVVVGVGVGGSSEWVDGSLRIDPPTDMGYITFISMDPAACTPSFPPSVHVNFAAYVWLWCLEHGTLLWW